MQSKTALTGENTLTENGVWVQNNLPQWVSFMFHKHFTVWNKWNIGTCAKNFLCVNLSSCSFEKLSSLPLSKKLDMWWKLNLCELWLFWMVWQESQASQYSSRVHQLTGSDLETDLKTGANFKCQLWWYQQADLQKLWIISIVLYSAAKTNTINNS